MLMSPFVQSEKKDGVIYVTFEESGLGETKTNNETQKQLGVLEQQVPSKKAKTLKNETDS